MPSIFYIQPNEASMIWDLIGTISGKVLDIVDDVVEDKDVANDPKFQIQKELIRRP